MSNDQFYKSDNQYCVYILASKRNGTLYIGVTSNIISEYRYVLKLPSRNYYLYRANSLSDYSRRSKRFEDYGQT